MTARVIASGQWDDDDVTMTAAAPQWHVGQIVDVAPRTWIGINRPGGTGRITKVHYASNGTTVESLDVKYTVSSGFDNHLDPDLVKPHRELAARGRRRTKPEQIAVGMENNKQEQNPRARSKAEKPVAKKKSSPSQKKKAPGKEKKTRKVLQQLVHAAVSTPTVVSQPELDIPIREIIFSASGISSSGTPMATTSDTICSPLGQEGVESKPSSSASYSKMICDTEKACIKSPLASDSDNEDPFLGCFDESPNVNSKLLASGCFSDEKDGKLSAARFNDDENSTSSKDKSTRVHLSLREVFDDNVKKANRFIGDVVARAKIGDSSEPSEGNMPTKADDDQRLDKFRTLLNEVLLNCDGMISNTNVGEQIQAYASTSGDDFDFTDAEINDFLSQLCEQNKIMCTEGMIYNI